MTTALEQVLEVLQCPRCRHRPLELKPGKLVCNSCASEFPIESQVPNFILTDSHSYQDPRWRAAQNGYERPYWENKQQEQELPAEHPVVKYWKLHADAQYAKYLQFRNQSPARSCLEIGGGRTPRIHFLPAPIKIAVDPLMTEQYRSFPRAYENIVCFNAMAESLPVADRCIDYAVMSNCLDHFAKPDIALREVFRVLTADGLVFISLETFTGFWRLWHKAFDKAHPHRWTIRDQHELIARCGGSVVSFEVDPPELRQWYTEVALSPRRKLALLLKKEQGSWIFAKPNT